MKRKIKWCRKRDQSRSASFGSQKSLLSKWQIEQIDKNSGL